MGRAITYLKAWSNWQKHNQNDKFYKLLVLLGTLQSPTFLTDYYFYAYYKEPYQYDEKEKTYV